jgi:histone H3/H4
MEHPDGSYQSSDDTSEGIDHSEDMAEDEPPWVSYEVGESDSEESSFDDGDADETDPSSGSDTESDECEFLLGMLDDAQKAAKLCNPPLVLAQKALDTELENILGFEIEWDPARASPAELKEEIRIIEDALDASERARDSALGSLDRALRVHEDVIDEAAFAGLPAGRDKEIDNFDYGAETPLKELDRMATKARDRVDAIITGAPSLKRKRDEWVAVEEIRAEQNNTEPIIHKDRFGALSCEILQDYMDGADVKFTSAALDALQAAAEDYLVQMFDSANRAAIHAGREKLTCADLHLARKSRAFKDIL